MAITGTSHNVLKYTSSGTATGRRVVGFLRWVGATTAGHTAVLADASGNEYFRSEADGANFIDIFPLHKVMNGQAVTMSSGTFYVYTE